LLRLILRKAGLHGKISFRQIECFLQFEWFGHRSIGENSFCAVISQECTAGNIGKSSVTTYVTMNAIRCQPVWGCNLFGPARIVLSLDTYQGKFASIDLGEDVARFIHQLTAA